MDNDIINLLNNIDFENNDKVYEIIKILYKENRKLKKIIHKAKNKILCVAYGKSENYYIEAINEIGRILSIKKENRQ